MALPLSGMERQALAGLAVSVVVMAMLNEVVQLREIGEQMHTQFLEGTMDYYAVLGVKDTASQQEISTAYKRKTSVFHSRNKNEEERRKRAKIVTAHETLSNAEMRRRYDSRRRILSWIGYGLTGGCMLVPLIGLIALSIQLMKYINPGSLDSDLRKFEGQLSSTFRRIETSIQVTLNRTDFSQKLGMELVNANSGPGLQVKSVGEGGMVHAHNEQIDHSEVEADPASTGGPTCLWWTSTELRTGDVITAVNGRTRQSEMFPELASASELQLAITRPLQGLLPWVMEVELTRTSSTERWGCELGPVQDSSDTFQVMSDNFAGAMARWNEANPALRVRKGDRIVAVNRKLKAKRMTVIMKDPATLSSVWLIVRGTIPVQAAPLVEVLSGPFIKRKQGDLLGIRIGLALEKPVRGTVLEAGTGGATVIKEVRAGHLVDQWNKQAPGQKVAEGYTVLSVNGRADPKEFAQELSKPSVLLRVRPPRNVRAKLLPAPLASAEAAAQALEASREPQPEPLCLEEETPLAMRLFGGLTPSWLRPSSFEDRLRASLAKLRCEFEVEVTRGPDDKIGMLLNPSMDAVGGLTVTEVSEEGLIGQHNRTVEGRKPTVQAGDHLVCVNKHTAVPPMAKELGNNAIDRLSMRFSRKAAEAAPGVWEAEVERFGGEGWGMELREEVNTNRSTGSGALLIEQLHPGLAIDRWNNKFRNSDRKSGWEVEPGDLIVGAAPKVGVQQTLAKLKASKRVRLTLLRWHAGPAPEPPASPRTAGRTFEVVLEKSSPADKLGVSLDPCERDPTRTAVAKVVQGGMVDRHNQASTTTADNDVQPGDEVESVNGEPDPSRFFSECSKAERIVLRLTRRPKPGAEVEPLPAPIEEVAVAPVAATPAPPAESPQAAAPAPPAEPVTPAAPRAVPAPKEVVKVPSPAPAAPVASPAPEAAVAPPPPAPARAVSMPTPAPSPVAVPANPAAPEVARENMLLKAEVAQLRNQLASQSMREERDRLLLECERLRAENVVMQTEMDRIQRRSDRDRAHAEDVQASADGLRAEVARLQAQEQSLQQSLRQMSERVASSARPHFEEPQLVAEPHLRSLEEGARSLQELCASLEHVLSSEI